MPMSTTMPCPNCEGGVGVARAVRTVPDRPIVMVKLTCEGCQHEWEVERPSTTPKISQLPNNTTVSV